MAESSFAELLAEHIRLRKQTADRLHQLSDLPKSTIVHWKNGDVRRPRDYVGIVSLAVALALPEPQVDELLRAAGHPPLRELLRVAPADAASKLADFLERLPLQPTLLDRAVGAPAHGNGAQPDVARLQALPRGSLMPLPSNPLFVGRTSELRRLAELLDPTQPPAATVAVAGLGGLGKTQLAVELVHRFGAAFPGGVLWLSFADPASIPPQVAGCGGPGALALADDWSSLALDTQLRLVRAAWHRPVPRLLIFDNCENAALLERWRPTTGGCRVLLTTRQLDWEAALGVHVLALRVLPRGESVALLRRHRPDLEPDAPGLTAIAAELGDLPLALNLAGHYLARYRYAVTPADYLRQLQEVSPLAHPSMQTGGRSPTAHLQHVERTLALSVERLDPAQPGDARAGAMLERMACFAPGEPVARALLFAALQPDAAVEPVAAEDALLRLGELALVEDGGQSGLRMHRLVAQLVRRRTAGTEPLANVERVVLARARQLNDLGDVLEMSALRPHLNAVTDAALERDSPYASDLGYALGYHLWLLADYPAAERYLEATLAVLNRAPQPDPERVASTLSVLALTHQLQCVLDAAQRRFEQALAVCETAFGPEHPLTVDEVNNLGYLRLLQGDYSAAEGYLRRALVSRHRRFGLRSVQCARSIHNVGYLALKQGRLRRARRYLALALALRRALLPSPHLSTAYTLNFLGETLLALGDSHAAEAHFRESLAMRQALFGEHHHDTAESLANLGRVCAAEGDDAAARALFEQALALYLPQVGAEHRDTAFTLLGLGALLRRQGDLVQAQRSLLQAQTAWEQQGGVEHPELVPVLTELGLLALARGQPGTARRALERACEIAGRRLDEAHPDARRAMALLRSLER